MGCSQQACPRPVRPAANVHVAHLRHRSENPAPQFREPGAPVPRTRRPSSEFRIGSAWGDQDRVIPRSPRRSAYAHPELGTWPGATLHHHLPEFHGRQLAVRSAEIPPGSLLRMVCGMPAREGRESGGTGRLAPADPEFGTEPGEEAVRAAAPPQAAADIGPPQNRKNARTRRPPARASVECGRRTEHARRCSTLA